MTEINNIIFVNITNLLDIYTTYIGINYFGCIEYNPFMKGLNNGMYSIYFIKIIYILVCSLFIFKGTKFNLYVGFIFLIISLSNIYIIITKYLYISKGIYIN